AVGDDDRFDPERSNIAEASQSATVTNSSIEIDQTGNNLATATQRGYGQPNSNNQNADIVQSGNLNRADTDQRGSNLQVTVTQTGDGNNAFLNQDFVVAGATSCVVQSGNNNFADSLQQGVGGF